MGRTLLHPRRQESCAALRARPDPRCDALRAAPRRHLPTPTRRGSSSRRQRVRHQPADAQRSLRLRHRRPPPTRTKTRRHRVARSTRRTYGALLAWASVTRRRDPWISTSSKLGEIRASHKRGMIFTSPPVASVWRQNA